MKPFNFFSPDPYAGQLDRKFPVFVFENFPLPTYSLIWVHEMPVCLKRQICENSEVVAFPRSSNSDQIWEMQEGDAGGGGNVRQNSVASLLHSAQPTFARECKK